MIYPIGTILEPQQLQRLVKEKNGVWRLTAFANAQDSPEKLLQMVDYVAKQEGRSLQCGNNLLDVRSIHQGLHHLKVDQDILVRRQCDSDWRGACSIGVEIGEIFAGLMRQFFAIYASSRPFFELIQSDFLKDRNFRVDLETGFELWAKRQLVTPSSACYTDTMLQEFRHQLSRLPY